MPGLSSDAEDELLAWIEAAQPVTRLCEIALAARHDDERSPDAAAGVPKRPAEKVSRPSQLTYGELPLRQLKTALAKIREQCGLAADTPGGGCRFFDLGCGAPHQRALAPLPLIFSYKSEKSLCGSGGGKLVLGAAVLLEPLTESLDVVGIELVESLVAEAEALRAQCTAKLRAAGEAGPAAAVAAARFVCGDVLDEATAAAAGVDWVQDEEAAAASSPPRCTVVLVNGLCFPSAVLAAICERLLRQPDPREAPAASGCSRELPGRFVLSTSPLPWDLRHGRAAPRAGQAAVAAGGADAPRVAALQPIISQFVC